MSLNVGIGESRYVVVSGVTMKFSVSENILFADLRTSHKTGRHKVDKATGEIVTDNAGKPVPERTYTHWEGRFIGGALEAAKGLRDGTAINILNGWVDKYDKQGKDGKTYTNIYVAITDFEVCDTDLNEDEQEGRE